MTKHDEQIFALLKRGPAGIRALVCDSGVPKRTLIRTLNGLIDQGRIVRVGQGPATTYRLVDERDQVAHKESRQEKNAEGLNLGTKGAEVFRLIRNESRPKAAGYQHTFLANYLPNQTFYLKVEEREELLKQGQMVDANLPAGTYARKIIDRLLIDLSWNSSRLEGNTYSLLDTKRLIKFGTPASGKDAKETQMIINHKHAIEFLVESAEELVINRYSITNLHGILADNLLGNQADVGRIRHISVGIGGTSYVPLAVPQLIEEYFDEILNKAQRIEDPFEQAFFVLVHIPYLQPFVDVNKRVSRLAANIPLIVNNLCPLSFVDIPNDIYVSGLLGIYELNQVHLLKDVFIWAYQRSCDQYSVLRQSMGEPNPIRLRYRSVIYSAVAQIIKTCETQQQASALIGDSVKNVPDSDRELLKEMIESELLAIHEGNFARFQVRPSEYERWVARWGHA